MGIITYYTFNGIPIQHSTIAVYFGAIFTFLLCSNIYKVPGVVLTLVLCIWP